MEILATSELIVLMIVFLSSLVSSGIIQIYRIIVHVENGAKLKKSAYISDYIRRSIFGITFGLILVSIISKDVSFIIGISILGTVICEDTVDAILSILKVKDAGEGQADYLDDTPGEGTLDDNNTEEER